MAYFLTNKRRYVKKRENFNPLDEYAPPSKGGGGSIRNQKLFSPVPLP
ncbi:hypothetical protein CSUNSWCD_390 [Campylobacter showae CSUNSWCD]|uniref:Uncharacterized protein n=1 Tax=Campylobacter showae CSUNSWCD TaxID=1244083 RepID=M5IMB1_9BACT|nr:hypothetical protein CSUNSWCD_390 [Campylobacter showae CSUNSWCD]